MSDDKCDELITTEILVDDLDAKIRDIDKSIFAARRYSSPMVLRILRRGDECGAPRAPIHIGDCVSYLSVWVFKVRSLAGLANAPRTALDTYIIWTEPTSRWVEMILAGTMFSGGRGHAAIKEQWFLLSLALVRARIRSHPEWFPKAELRTCSALIKHRDLFAIAGDELSGPRKFLQEARLSEEKFLGDPAMIDIYWTLRLVAGALEQGMEYDQALAFLFSDEL